MLMKLRPALLHRENGKIIFTVFEEGDATAKVRSALSV